MTIARLFVLLGMGFILIETACGTLHNIGVIDVRPETYKNTATPGYMPQTKTSLFGGVATDGHVLGSLALDDGRDMLPKVILFPLYLIDIPMSFAGDFITFVPIALIKGKG